MTRTLAVMFLTALAIFAQGSTTDPDLNKVISQIDTLKTSIEQGPVKNLERAEQELQNETEVLRTLLNGAVVDADRAVVSLQYVRVYAFEQKRLEAAQALAGMLGEAHQNYESIRRNLDFELIRKYGDQLIVGFDQWYDSTLDRCSIVHAGLDEVMLAAAKLLPPGNKRDVQVRLWKDHGTEPHYIKCKTLTCNDPAPLYAETQP